MNKPRPTATATIATIAAIVATGCGSSNSGSACDRECLVEMADSYLTAIAAHDPETVPFADGIAFVENGVALSPGEGIWAAAAGAATAFRINVPDPVEGTVGIIVRIDRRAAAGAVPALLAVRLTIEGRKIVEAEHLVTDVPAEADLARLTAPRPNLTAGVPEGEQMPRAELAAIGGSYYEALESADGELAPFAADCEREENGVITAGPGLAPAPFASVDVNGRSPPPVARDCVGQMSSRRFAYIDSIDNRRVFAVDPVQGLAMGLSHFHSSMTRGPQLMRAADGSQVLWEERRDPYDLLAAHIFKITTGQIHEVEAIGLFVPYGSPTGWE